MNEPNQDKPKIIIDEDWKTQVEREREQAESHRESPPQPAASGLPEASFEVLVSTLATQAMASLGQLPDPTTGKAMVHLDFAKLQIDLIEMLMEKTKGNLTQPEANLLQDALHQLRMLYVATEQQLQQQQQQQQPPPQPPQ